MPSRPTQPNPSPSLNLAVPRLGGAELNEAARLDDQLCFALYAASNAIQRTYAAPLRELGLTYLQYLVVLALLERSDRTVGDIGQSLYLDSGTLTPVLRRLERQGFIERRRSKRDEREVRVSLTDAGAELQPRLVAVRNDVACRSALTAEAVTRLRDELQTLRTQLVAPV